MVVDFVARNPTSVPGDKYALPSMESTRLSFWFGNRQDLAFLCASFGGVYIHFVLALSWAVF